MIPFEKALDIILNCKTETGTETLLLHQSLNRILSQDVISDIEMPPFDKAAMDGFAIYESDIENELDIIETVAAGQMPQKYLHRGQATKIMTGAPIPEGADFVIQVELSETSCQNKVVFNGHPKNNIIYKGSDVKKGEKVLTKGCLIQPQHIAVLAAAGYPNVQVYKQPKVGVIATGSEIVEPEIQPLPSQIRNSNGHQLVAQIIQAGGIPIYLGIVADQYQATLSAFKNGLENVDILLLTGGVSMGEFDFVPKIMHELGIEILFNKVAVQPGKPTIFGKTDTKFIYGLPGNPVSSFVQFEFLVKPLIQKMTGIKHNAGLIKLPLQVDFSRKKSDRKAFIPANISADSKVYPINYHGSAHIFALPNAHGFFIIEQNIADLKKGDLVDVRLF